MLDKCEHWKATIWSSLLFASLHYQSRLKFSRSDECILRNEELRRARQSYIGRQQLAWCAFVRNHWLNCKSLGSRLAFPLAQSQLPVNCSTLTENKYCAPFQWCVLESRIENQLNVWFILYSDILAFCTRNSITMRPLLSTGPYAYEECKCYVSMTHNGKLSSRYMQYRATCFFLYECWLKLLWTADPKIHRISKQHWIEKKKNLLDDTLLLEIYNMISNG